MENAYSKVIELVRQKRGLPEMPVLAFNNEDVKWILGIPEAKEPKEIQRLKKRGSAA